MGKVNSVNFYQVLDFTFGQLLPDYPLEMIFMNRTEHSLA
jgi:hypothetical protein